LGITQTIKAADSALNHDQRTYTNVPTEATSATHGKHHGGGNKKRQNSHHNSESSSRVKDAIDAPKKTVDDALKGSKGSNGSHSKNKHRNRNRRSTSGENEVASLRAEVAELHEENASIRKELDELRALIQKLSGTSISSQPPKTAPVKEGPKPAADEDFDLFDSDEDEESEEAKKIREDRLKAYAEKKSKKPGPIAKSSIIMDVKPWADDTNLDEMEANVKSIVMDGLLWGATKKVPIGYGISKLQIVCTVEDDKVSVDDLQEKIQEFEEYVQSVDIVAFNKI